MSKRHVDEPPGDFPLMDDPPPTPMRRPHWRTAALAALAAGVLTLIGAEIWARTISAPPPGENAWTRHPIERGYEIAHPDGGFRVLVLGDELHGGAFEALEARYQSRWSYPYQIIELDPSANSPAEIFKAYTESARQYRPNVVILTISPSDLRALDPDLSGGLEAVYYGLNDAGALVTLDVQARSGGVGRISALARVLAGPPREDIPDGAHLPAAGRVEKGFSDPRYTTAYEVFVALVSAIQTQVQAEGSQFGVILVPDAYTVYPEWYFDTYPQASAHMELYDAGKIEREMLAMLEAYGINHFELMPYLNTPITGVGARHALPLQRDGRLTSAGHDFVTEALDNWFSQSGWAAALSQ